MWKHSDSVEQWFCLQWRWCWAIFKVHHNFCASLPCPAQTCSSHPGSAIATSFSWVLQAGQGWEGSFLMLGKVRSRKCSYIPALLLSASSILLPPRKTVEKVCWLGDPGCRNSCEKELCKGSDSVSLGLREKKVTCSCVLFPQFCVIASARVPGNLTG